MSFAEFGGTPREVRAEPTGFNNCDLDAEWCYSRDSTSEKPSTPHFAAE